MVFLFYENLIDKLLSLFRRAEEDDDDDGDEGGDGEREEQRDYAEYEDIYDNVFFPEAPKEEVKRRTLRISPDDTAEDGIFSFENKVNIQ